MATQTVTLPTTPEAPEAPKSAPKTNKPDPIEALELKILKIQNLLAALACCDADRTHIDNLTMSIEVANDLLSDVAEDVGYLARHSSEMGCA